MPTGRIQAGAATSNVTPALGVSLNGGMHDRTATHIHDELHARCLVLDDGHTRVGLAIVDSCMIPRAILDRAKHLAHERTEIPLDRLLVAATHTHSAPTVAGVFQSEPDDEYAAFLALRIADGFRRAVNLLRPAAVGWAVVDEPAEVFNRRWRMQPGSVPPDPFGQTRDQVQMNPPRGSENLLEPAGPTDPAVSLLAVRDAEGRPLALLANYSLHYVGGTAAGHVSADYFGMFADEMVARLGTARQDPPLVVAMSNGTSGNINNINFRQAAASQPAYAQMRHVAAAVAQSVERAYHQLEFHEQVPLAMCEQRVEVGCRRPAADEVQRARYILSQSGGADLNSLEQIYARETALMAEWPARVETLVQAVRLGELGIVTLPCEVFVETGLAVKGQSPLETTFVIELANDYCGYLPTPEQMALGGYETWRARSSFLDAEAEPRLRQTALELLGRVARG